jgi:putative Ca2+/H+ antiporter (TMEM165/GDT1 family)
MSLDALLVSTGVVALAEMGDKTQLLALVLAARFPGRAAAIVAGILAATLLNHAMAGALGAWLPALFSPSLMRWILGGGFLAMAAWTLIPDKLDDDEQPKGGRWGVFGTTFVAFFLAEMGDKTQIATVALAAQYVAPLAVIAGTTAGMMIANVPAVFVGQRFAQRIPMKLVHGVAAALFAALGAATLLGLGERFGL